MGLFFFFGFFVLMIGADLLCVLVLVEGGELDEGAVRCNVRPLVEADDKAVDVEEEVVVRLLESLGDGV